MAVMLDTGVVIDLAHHQSSLPNDDLAISTATLAELWAGALIDSPDRAMRRQHLDRVRAFLDPYDIDSDVARMYGRMVAAVRRAGRLERSHVADLLIAATAAVNDMPLYTTDPDHFAGLDNLVDVFAV